MDAFQLWSSPAAVPLFALGGFTLLLCLCFCCFLCCLRRQSTIAVGYKEICYHQTKQPYETCPVCLDDFVFGEKIALCNCKHSFHLKCLEHWITQNSTCPLCKAPVRPRENTPLIYGAERNQILNSRV